MIINMIQVDNPSEVSDEARWGLMRMNRDLLLQRSDWRVMSDRPDSAEWVEWRQKLRDFPETWQPSDVVNFPDSPEQM
jgi:hypothetical protein